MGDPCFAFRIESRGVIGRVKIEYCAPGLDLSALPSFISDAVDLWAASAGAASGTVACASPGPWIAPPPATTPGDGAPSEGTMPPVALPPAESSADRPWPPPTQATRRTLAGLIFQSTGRVPTSRLKKAAELGRAWQLWLAGGGERPTTEGPAVGPGIYWAVLRAGPWDAAPQTASLHDRRGVPGPTENPGYWGRIATRTTWRTGGEEHEDTVHLGFGSLDETFTFFESAGYEPAEVLDLRVGRGGRA